MSKKNDLIYEKFQFVLDEMSDKDVRKFTISCLKVAPDYFWHVSSSTSGNHHPADEFSDGGLVLHTQRTCKVALSLIRTLPSGNPSLKDYILSACILHDTLKDGIPNRLNIVDGVPFTDRLHTIYPRIYYPQKVGIFYFSDIIFSLIEGHMGVWSTSVVKDLWKSSEAHRIVAMADYIASRRFIHIEV